MLTAEALSERFARDVETHLFALLLRPPPFPAYLGLWLAPALVETAERPYTVRATRESFPIAVATEGEVDALLARETQRFHREHPAALEKCGVIMLRSGGEWTVPVEKIAAALKLPLAHFAD